MTGSGRAGVHVVGYAGMPCTVLLTLPVGAILYYNGSLDLNTWIFVLMLDLSMSGPLTRVINFFSDVSAGGLSP